MLPGTALWCSKAHYEQCYQEEYCGAHKLMMLREQCYSSGTVVSTVTFWLTVPPVNGGVQTNTSAVLVLQ